MCFKDVSSTFESTSRLLCFFLKFIVACHSSQLPEQKEGLFKGGPKKKEEAKILLNLI